MAQDNVNRRDVTSCYLLFRPTFLNCPLIVQPPVNSSRLSFLTLRGRDWWETVQPVVQRHPKGGVLRSWTRARGHLTSDSVTGQSKLCLFPNSLLALCPRGRRQGNRRAVSPLSDPIQACGGRLLEERAGPKREWQRRRQNSPPTSTATESQIPP